MKLATSDPSEIEQVVNQSRLQLDVPLYNLNIFGELWRKFLRTIPEVRGCCQSRRQRRAQFVAERCQKIVFRLTRFLRCNFFRFKVSAAYLIGDRTCSFRKPATSAGICMRLCQ